MACQPSLWSTLPPDIGSEQHPRPCRAIEGGLSSRKIAVKKGPKKHKGVQHSALVVLVPG